MYHWFFYLCLVLLLANGVLLEAGRLPGVLSLVELDVLAQGQRHVDHRLVAAVAALVGGQLHAALT